MSLLGFMPFLAIAMWVTFRGIAGVALYRAVPEAFVLLALASFVITEGAGAFRALNFWPVFFGWLMLLVVLGAMVLRELRPGQPRPSFDLSHRVEPALVSFICVCALLIAVGAEPNNYDGLTYRLPRIEYWIQNGSPEHFLTNNNRQIAFSPLAEYMLMQTRLLSGGDRFYMAVQWLAMVSSLASVFHITLMLLGGRTLAWFAVVFAATLPMGIAQSTSVQNDYVAAALLLAFVQGIVLIAKQGATPVRIVLCVFAGSMACVTKPTALLMAVGFAIWLPILLARRVRPFELVAYGFLAILVFAFTFGSFALRNLQTFGSIQSNIGAIHTPGAVSAPVIADNIVLGIGSNLFTGIDVIDAVTVRAFLAFTAALGTNAQRADSMMPGFSFERPFRIRRVFHEDAAPNPLHMLLILAFAGLSLLAVPGRQGRHLVVYAVCCLAAVVAFAAGVRWQPWITRLQLPLFLLFAPLVAAGLGLFGRWRLLLICTFVLFIAALGPVLFNPIRPLLPIPLTAPPFYLQEKARLIFAAAPVFTSPYMAAITWLAERRIGNIGLLSRGDDIEYPFWPFLRRINSEVPLRIEPVRFGDQPLRRALGTFRPDAVIAFDDSLPATITIEGMNMNRTAAFVDRAGALEGKVLIYVPAAGP